MKGWTAASSSGEGCDFLNLMGTYGESMLVCLDSWIIAWNGMMKVKLTMMLMLERFKRSEILEWQNKKRMLPILGIQCDIDRR